MRGKLTLPATLVVTLLGGTSCGGGGDPGAADARVDAATIVDAAQPDMFCEFYCGPEPAIIDAGPLDPDAKADCPEVACDSTDCPPGCELA